MKTKLLCLVLLCLTTISSLQADELILLNGKHFEGTVKKVANCEIVFKAAKQKFTIPANDIYAIVFENPANPIFQDYLAIQDPEACLKAQEEAKEYHGQAATHILLGVLFGPFAMIGSAIATPSPQKDPETLLNGTKSLFDDPDYLNCYKRTARRMNIGKNATGWGIWISFVLILQSVASL